MSTRSAIESRIGPGDARYRAVLEKRFNKRFKASPDYVRLPSSTEQVVAAVEEAVHERKRLTVTSGGHCLEGFVSDPEVESDHRRLADEPHLLRPGGEAVAVEAGATVGETFRALFENWGVVVPLGEYPGIGMGGHVAGGAFGFLCRQLGLAADYLHAVEVVVVGCRRPRAQRRRHSRPIGSAPRSMVGTHRWRRRQLRHRDALLVPVGDCEGSDPRTSLPRAPRVDDRVQGRVALE